MQNVSFPVKAVAYLFIAGAAGVALYNQHSIGPSDGPLISLVVACAGLFILGARNGSTTLLTAGILVPALSLVYELLAIPANEPAGGFFTFFVAFPTGIMLILPAVVGKVISSQTTGRATASALLGVLTAFAIIIPLILIGLLSYS